MDGQGEEGEPHRELFVRPSYRQRANERWPFVIVPIGAMAAVGVLMSGRGGWGLFWNAVSAGYSATIAAILLTLLVALLPGKPRPLSETSRYRSGEPILGLVERRGQRADER